MNDRSLACFAASRRTGSFSLAARELSMTQQNVSYSIRRLEEELGFPLFVRRGQRVELTRWGEGFAGWYEALDADAARTARRGGAKTGPVTDAQVRCFLTAARTGSLEAAAQALFYAPQALAGVLTKLETALGERLLRRENGALSLTERGAAWQAVFDAAARTLETLADGARRDYDRAGREAAVGVSEWLSLTGPLGRALEGFSEGALTLRSLPNQALLEALESGEVDVAIWSEGHAPLNRGFDVTPLAAEELCLLTPADGRRCPVLVCPGWPRSFLENRVISTQETVFADYKPDGTVLAESLSELARLLRGGGYAAVSDRRFGTLCDIPGLTARPFHTGTRLQLCRKPNADGLCARRLTAYLKTALVGATKN